MSYLYVRHFCGHIGDHGYSDCTSSFLAFSHRSPRSAWPVAASTRFRRPRENVNAKWADVQSEYQRPVRPHSQSGRDREGLCQAGKQRC